MYNPSICPRLYDNFFQKSPRFSLPTGRASPRETTGMSRSPRRRRRQQTGCTLPSLPGDAPLGSFVQARAPQSLRQPRAGVSPAKNRRSVARRLRAPRQTPSCAMAARRLPSVRPHRDRSSPAEREARTCPRQWPAAPPRVGGGTALLPARETRICPRRREEAAIAALVPLLLAWP
jgi:hypothetical protein